MIPFPILLMVIPYIYYTYDDSISNTTYGYNKAPVSPNENIFK